ncbi:MAG: group II intron reverse transcriptase/maturase, partial [Flavobacteriales bacterium]
MIAKVIAARNLTNACNKVVRNKGSAGIDGMSTDKLKVFIDAQRSEVVGQLISKSYIPQAIKGVEIPKSKGKTRLLGVPTVVDRWLQQAVSQQLAIHFELDFEEESYGFRPRKNLQQAVLKSQEYIND